MRQTMPDEIIVSSSYESMTKEILPKYKSQKNQTWKSFFIFCDSFNLRAHIEGIVEQQFGLTES